jgi:hypothetical protein
VNLIVYGAASGAVPVESVTALECMITVYVVAVVSAVVGVIFNVLPVTLNVNGFAVPLAFLSSTNGLVPNLMASLKLMLITLFNATLT